MTEPVFRRWVVVALIGLGLASITFAALTGRMQPSAGAPVSAQPDSYSSSAVGHAALLELLEELGHTVHRSRRQARRVGEQGAVLLLLEPRPWDVGGLTRTLSDLAEDSDRTVLVLPKWWAQADPDNRAWAERLRWLPLERVESVLDDVGIRARVVRPGRRPDVWGGAGDARPELPHPQLLEGGNLAPLVSSDAGILVGLRETRISGRPSLTVVVSDPDLLSTHGLGLADNARIAVDALTRLQAGDAPLVVDETLHGHGLTANLAAELTRFPLVIGLIHVVLAVLVVLWAGLARFGPPVPAPSRRPSGQEALIENTAQLLVGAGRHTFLLDRYRAQTLQRVSAAFHIPAGLEEDERDGRLTDLARRRGLGDDPATLSRALHDVDLPAGSGPGSSRRALALASRIHQWHEDMLHGS